MKKMFLFALVTTLFITSCGQKQKGSNTLIRPVKTAQISSQSVIRKDFSGIVEAVEYVRLAFRVSGQIISLPVVEGQRVKKGQLIAAIDPRDISLQYAADKAAYETAAAQVERNKRLLGRQAISVQEYEISVANYQKAKSTYELSGNNMRDTRLTAPFEGSIEKRLVENYQRVNAGEGVVQLVNTQKLRIKFTVPDDYPGNFENVGYAAPGKACIYNILIMEEKQTIVACGAGTTTKVTFPAENRLERAENVKDVASYIERIDEMIDRKEKLLSKLV